ncbi:hypothetical protein BGX29_000917, partial [Mortierella sp. GBA35]
LSTKAMHTPRSVSVTSMPMARVFNKIHRERVSGTFWRPTKAMLKRRAKSRGSSR